MNAVGVAALVADVTAGVLLATAIVRWAALGPRARRWLAAATAVTLLAVVVLVPVWLETLPTVPDGTVEGSGGD